MKLVRPEKRQFYPQLFNDDGGQGDQGGADGDKGGGDADDNGGDAGGDAGGDDKSFSQKDVDDIVQKRLNREKAKLEKQYKESDEYKEYQNYLESKKTDQQKLDDKMKAISETEKENARLKAENEAMKNKATLKDVADGMEDFVHFEVSKLVNEDTDYAAALKQFKSNEANQKYFVSEEGDKNFKTGQRHQKGGGSSKLSDRSQAMLNKIGYGQKASK